MKEITKPTNGKEQTRSEFAEEYNARLQRAMLPIPRIPQQGLMTYDARDPETKYPPIAYSTSLPADNTKELLFEKKGDSS